MTTISILQHTGQGFINTTNGQLAFGSNVTAGSTILYAVRYFDVGSTYTISDNVNPGNYAQDRVQLLNSDGDTLIIGSYPNVAGGATTLSFKTTLAASKMQAAIVEVAGLQTSSILDQVNSDNNSGTAANSGNVTTTAASELIFSAVALSNDIAETITGSGSTTLLDAVTDPSTTFQCLASGFQIVSSTGIYAGAFAITGSEEWACAVATYKGAVAGDTLMGQICL